MRDLIAADSESDSQHMSPLHLLTETGVETRACMLNVTKVNHGGVRDGLNVEWSVKIRVRAWNGLAIDNADLLRKGVSRVWTLETAISTVPPGIHVQMHEVRQASDVVSTLCRTASQYAELIKVHGIKPFRLQVGVDIGRVANLVLSVAGDVLGTAAIKVLKCELICVL